LHRYHQRDPSTGITQLHFLLHSLSITNLKKKKTKDLAHINPSKNPVTMAEAEKGSATTGSRESNVKEEISLKDKGNEFFKAGNYLKAAALYTQAIKLDPSNPTLYR